MRELPQMQRPVHLSAPVKDSDSQFVTDDFGASIYILSALDSSPDGLPSKADYSTNEAP